MPDGATPPASARYTAAAASGHDAMSATLACVKKLGATDGATLGFVYVSDTLAPNLAEIVTTLRQTTGVPEWVGTVGIGVLGGDDEFFDQPAVAAMVTRADPAHFRRFPIVSADLAPLDRAAGEWLRGDGATVAFVHADPRNQQVPELLTALGQTTGAYVVGGLTSSRDAFPQVAASVTGGAMPAGPVTDGGVAGVLFKAEAGLQIGLSQGCLPIAGQHMITAAQDNVIIELDGRPALEVLKEDIGDELSRDLRNIGGLIFAALPIAGSDTGDYLVRNLVGIDAARGWVAIAETVDEGQALVFTRRDRATAEADLRRMLRNLKRRAGPLPKGGIYVSCLARGRNTFEEDGAELAIIRQELGDVPLVGFFAAGEISNARLYGYTGVLTLFT